MEDKLTEINQNDLPILRDIYKPDNSGRYITYVLIDTYMNWLQQDRNIKYLHFYCLNNDFLNGTFVVFDRATAYADTRCQKSDELHRLLHLVDYSEGYLFIHVTDFVAATIKETFKQKNIDLIFQDSFLNYFLPREKGLLFDVQPPDGIQLKPITKRSDIEKAFSLWKAASDGRRQLQFLLRQAKYNPSVGVFMKDGTMIAWVFRFPTGPLCALQTDANHIERGYGSLVTKAISKQIAESGCDVNAGVSESNTASRHLFEKLEFECIEKMHVLGNKLYWPQVDE